LKKVSVTSRLKSNEANFDEPRRQIARKSDVKEISKATLKS